MGADCMIHIKTKKECTPGELSKLGGVVSMAIDGSGQERYAIGADKFDAVDFPADVEGWYSYELDIRWRAFGMGHTRGPGLYVICALKMLDRFSTEGTKVYLSNDTCFKANEFTEELELELWEDFYGSLED